jgi:NitT/TauT family transport system ATP-binding protein
MGAARRFRTRAGEATVFEDLSLTIELGSFVSLVGASGCGKSTLLLAIAGLRPADAGEIRYLGHPTHGPHREIVYIFQDYTKSIFPWLTVAANVEFGLKHRQRLGRSERRTKARHFIELVGLAGYEGHYPSQLSGGMQQRVALARALACEPRVLLMDEPFSAVDALTRTRLQELVLELWSTMGLTILFVTHDVDEAVFLSSRVVVMGGRPATFVRDIPIDLPYPRDTIATPEDPRFLASRHAILTDIFSVEAIRSEK